MALDKELHYEDGLLWARCPACDDTAIPVIYQERYTKKWSDPLRGDWENDDFTVSCENCSVEYDARYYKVVYVNMFDKETREEVFYGEY